MIFRTGSCIIVGNCSERILRFVYEFIKDLLVREYYEIRVQNEEVLVKNKNKKMRKKKIEMTNEYYTRNCRDGMN
jgi:hypothetical protein